VKILRLILLPQHFSTSSKLTVEKKEKIKKKKDTNGDREREEFRKEK